MGGGAVSYERVRGHCLPARPAYGGPSLIRNCPTVQDPAEGLCLWPYGGPRGGQFLMSESVAIACVSVQGLGSIFRVEGVGFRVSGLGCRVQGETAR